MIIAQAIHAVICIVLAYFNAKWIKKGKYDKIKHGINGALHIGAAITCSILFVWWAFFIILCEARVLFNTALYLFQGLPIDYVTLEKKPRGILDRMEKKVFGLNGWAPLLIYIVGWIGLNVLYVVL